MVRRDADDGSEGNSWLVLRHVPAEGLGLLANVLREIGVQHRYLDVARGEAPPRDLRDVGGLVVLGGPVAVYEAERHAFLRTELALVERAITAGRPVLGICLGAQMIAHALGARVYAGEKREVGWAPVTLTPEGRDDAVFGTAGGPFTVFHLHGDTYELPPDAENLATSPVYEQQAFRWGEVVYGIQFHLEFTDATITRLATEPESRAYMVAAGADPQRLVTESPEHVRRLGDTAQRIFTAFFRQCGL
jgi:GMP synthase (glutamine-hydrolysing)